MEKEVAKEIIIFPAELRELQKVVF